MRWPFRRRPRELELDLAGVRAELLLFARCGGRPTLAEFSALPTPVAEVLAECQRAVRAEEACAHARAAQGEVGFAEVQAMVDPDAVRGSLLAAALDAGAARRGEAP